jgi:hypothetical protein
MSQQQSTTPLETDSTSMAPLAIGLGMGLVGLLVGAIALVAKNSRIESIDRNDIRHIFPSPRRDGVVVTLEDGERLELSYRAVKTIGSSARQWRQSIADGIPFTMDQK